MESSQAMANIRRSAQTGKSNTFEITAAQDAARAVLDSDKDQLGKDNRVFLQAVTRHGLLSPEGRARLNALRWLVGGQHGATP